MKRSVSKSMAVCLMALVGYNSISASPTFMPSCFETEKEAKAHQSAHAYREVDNSEAAKKDERAMPFAWRDDVKLAELEAILGKAEVTVDKITQVMSYEWNLSFIGSPSANPIRYDSSQGYCLSTRMAGVGIITYIWKAEVFDKTRGSLTRREFYM